MSKLKNCERLLAVIDGKIERKEPERYLDQYIEENECGTFYCILGEYLKDDNIPERELFSSYCMRFDTFEEFGIHRNSDPSWVDIFGVRRYLTHDNLSLEERRDELMKYIERLS